MLRNRSYDFAWLIVFDFLTGVIAAFVVRGILAASETTYNLLKVPPNLGGISFAIFVGSILTLLLVLFLVPIALSVGIWELTGFGYVIPPLHMQLVAAAFG